MKKLHIQTLALLLLTATAVLNTGCRAIRNIGQNQHSIAARRLSRQGIQAMREGEWSAAENLFNDALAESDHDDRAHRGLAESLWQRGEPEVAIKHMEQAVRLSAGDPKLVERLGRMYLDVGRLDDANRQCTRALEADRTSAQTWALRGDCLYAQGQSDQALAAYHRALALQPDFIEVQLQAAEIYRSQGRYDRLLATLDRLQENTLGDQVPARFDMLKGFAMQQLGRGTEAKRCFQNASNKHPDTAEPHLMMAAVSLDDGDLDSARTAVARAMELDPAAVQQGRWLEQLENHQRRQTIAAKPVSAKSISTK
jgi:tetratricopeptide (TPR) repeat protein